MQKVLDLVTQLRSNPESTWVFTKRFFADLGFGSIACGAVEKSTGNFSGLLLKVPNGWISHYTRENYMQVDPWPQISISATEPFVYSFSNRSTQFSGRSDTVERFLCDMHEIELNSSMLLPPTSYRG